MGSTMTARGGVILGAWPGRGIGGGRGPSSLGRGVRCVGSNPEDSLNSRNTAGIFRMKYGIREFGRENPSTVFVPVFTKFSRIFS